MQVSGGFDKIRKTIRIYAVVQVVLIALLVYVAVMFQAKLQLTGRTQNFMNAVIITAVIQLGLFFPIYKFANREATRDLAIHGAIPSSDDAKTLAKKKRNGEIIKGAVFFFFAMFILQAPNNALVLSVLFFSFILTVLSYLQCYNFAAKKLVR